MSVNRVDIGEPFKVRFLSVFSIGRCSQWQTREQLRQNSAEFGPDGYTLSCPFPNHLKGVEIVSTVGY